MSTLNRFFHALGIPYQIKSKPSKKVLRNALTGEKVIDPVTGKAKIDNTTYWRILPVDLEEARRQEETRKQEKLRKSEERKRQKELAALPAPLPNDTKKKTLQVRVNRGTPVNPKNEQ